MLQRYPQHPVTVGEHLRNMKTEEQTTAPHFSSRIVVRSAILTFLLHFAWESLQCIPFFVHETQPRHGFFFTMARAAAGDVFLTALGYVILALSFRQIDWPSARWRPLRLLVVECVAITLAIVTEIVALRHGRWSYTSGNPLIPGLGVSWLPVLQLMILFPISFATLRHRRRLG